MMFLMILGYLFMFSIQYVAFYFLGEANIVLLLPFLVGWTLQIISSICMQEAAVDSDVRDVLYYLGMAFILIPVLIVSFQYPFQKESELSFMKVCYFSMQCFSMVALWWGDGCLEEIGFGAVPIGIASTAIVFGIGTTFLSLHVLSILNIIFGLIGIGVIIFMRVTLGSNLE